MTLEHLIDDLLDMRETAKTRIAQCFEREADADAVRWSRELRDGNLVIAKLAGLYRENAPVASQQVNVFAAWPTELIEAFLDPERRAAVIDALQRVPLQVASTALTANESDDDHATFDAVPSSSTNDAEDESGDG